MKFAPIKPTVVGCLNCSNVPEKTLNMEDKVSFDFTDSITCYIGNELLELHFHEELEDITLKEICEKYKEIIDRTDAFLVTFESALHGEVYELNKEDNKFYLVDRTTGWC